MGKLTHITLKELNCIRALAKGLSYHAYALTDIVKLYMAKVDSEPASMLFCSQDKLIKILLAFSSKSCAQWRKSLNGLLDNYVINQLAIQIGWLIGYFSHLQSESPEIDIAKKL